MNVQQSCPFCGIALSPDAVSQGRALACPGCGATVMASPAETNPYAAPSAPLDPAPDYVEVMPVVRTSVLRKYQEAFRLLVSHLDLFSLLVLTVWLPANLLINYLAYQGSLDEGGMAYFRFNMCVESFFSPLYTGGILHALRVRRQQGRRASYGEAIAVGIRNWGRLFGARFFAGLQILLGFIALIIPGIILSVRYTILDPVVVLDKHQGNSALRRSKELSRGIWWSILGAALIFWLVFLPISLAANSLAESFDEINNMAVATVLDCVLEIFATIFTIVMFLFYWEQVHCEPSSSA